MKHYLLTFSFILSGLWLVACAGQQSPLSPSSPLTSQKNNQGTNMPVPEVVSYPSDVTSPLSIRVRYPGSSVNVQMAQQTLTSSTVRVYEKLSDTSETEVTYFTIVYDPALHILNVTPNLTWLTDRHYRVELSDSIQSAGGQGIDGNGNRIDEASDFDTAHFTFSTGTPSASAYVLNALQLTGASLTHAGGTASCLTPVSSIPAENGVTLTATFSLELDSDRIFTNAFTLHPNITLVNLTTNTATTPVSISMPTESSIEFYFLPASSAVYEITFSGGINGIRSSMKSTQSLLPGRLFGGKNNPTVAESADAYSLYFSTATSGGSATAPPTVSNCTYSGGTDRFWTVTFTAPSSGSMNTTDFTADHFTLEATISSTTYNVPIKAVEQINTLQVRVYVPDLFYPSNGTTNTDKVKMICIVHRTIRDLNGIYLDGNSDGVGGLSNDDYRSTSAQVYPKR